MKYIDNLKRFSCNQTPNKKGDMNAHLFDYDKP